MPDFNTPLSSALTTSPGGAFIPSAARTTAISDVIPNIPLSNAVGILVWVVVTAASGTGGLTVSVKALPPNATTGGTTIGAAAAAVIANGATNLMIYPGGGAASTYTTAVSNTIPPRISINVAVGDASSYTYSIFAYALV